MKFIQPGGEELFYLRADPLIVEQELDVRPGVAEAIERAVGVRSGRAYWRSVHDHLYALELGDLGRGRPSTATVYGHWDRYEPRPPEHEIDADLLAFSLWAAKIADSLDPENIARVATFAAVQTTWPAGSVLRTPSERFTNLPGYPYEPRFVEVEGLQMAYVDTGEGDPILMLHGEPTWGYLYRKMIPPLAETGRAVVPDLVGFGRSDKPVAANAYSYKSHVRWLRKFVEALDLERITLVCQDWGGLLGLRLLSEQPERFARLVAMNTGIPHGRAKPEHRRAFLQWRRYSQRQTELNLPWLMKRELQPSTVITDEELAAYQAPFPSKEYQTAALVFPRLVPIHPDDPGAYDNRNAIERLKKLHLPVILIWGAQDPITAPSKAHLCSIFPQAAPPIDIEGAGHFIQEDAGEEVARRITM